jgi:hypothetical protein
MQYTLMLYMAKDEFDARTHPEKRDAFWGALPTVFGRNHAVWNLRIRSRATAA